MPFNKNNKPLMLSNSYIRHNRANSGLPQDAWKQIDGAVIEPFKAPNIILNDLESRGLTQNIPFHVTLSEFQKRTGRKKANVTLSGRANIKETTTNYDKDAVPVPVIHEDYSLDRRRLEASQASNVESLDVTEPNDAGEVVRDTIDDIIFNGYGKIKVNNNATIYGLTTHPHRNTITIANAWDTSTPGAPYCINDTASMLQAAYNDNKYGPFGLYLPKNYWGPLQLDYAPESGVTWIDRILRFTDIEYVHLGKSLDDNNVVLLDLSLSTIDMAISRSPATITWESGDGWEYFFKTFAVMVPRIKTDTNNQSGVVHAST